MARFLFFMFLAAFLTLGVFCFFFLDIDASAVFSDKSGGAGDGYGGFILKDDFTIRSVLSRVASECPYGDSECVAVKAFGYVKNDIALSEGGYGGKAPKNTLSERSGDAADKAVLLASFLENGGISAEVADKDDRPVVYAAGLDILKLYEEIVKDIHKTPLAKRDVTLKKGGIWVVNLISADGKPVSVDISAKSSEVFDMLLFPGETEMKAYLGDGSGRFLDECSLVGVYNAEISCLSPAGGRLLFISGGDGAVFSGRIFKGGILLSDIKSVDSEKGVLIPMDPAFSSDTAYPGVMPVKKF